MEMDIFHTKSALIQPQRKLALGESEPKVVSFQKWSSMDTLIIFMLTKFDQNTLKA